MAMNEYLGIWQLNDLKDAISSVEVAGSIVEVANLLLVDEADASETFVSLVPMVKKSAAALVGEAKGLSGRLCSKLHSIMRYTIRKMYRKSLAWFKIEI